MLNTVCKTLSIAICVAFLQVPNASAGGTNTGNNTSAQPGDNSTSTHTPADAGGDRRKGTTKTNELNTPNSNTNQNSGSHDSKSGQTNKADPQGNSGTGTTGGNKSY